MQPEDSSWIASKNASWIAFMSFWVSDPTSVDSMGLLWLEMFLAAYSAMASAVEAGWSFCDPSEG